MLGKSFPFALHKRISWTYRRSSDNRIAFYPRAQALVTLIRELLKVKNYVKPLIQGRSLLAPPMPSTFLFPLLLIFAFPTINSYLPPTPLPLPLQILPTPTSLTIKTPTYSYTKSGTTITLIPTIHIGPESYYEKINSKLEGLTFLELLLPSNLKELHSKYQNVSSPTSEIKSPNKLPFKDLINQLDVIQPNATLNRYILDLSLSDLQPPTSIPKLSNLPPPSSSSSILGSSFFLSGLSTFNLFKFLSAILLPSPEIWALVFEWIRVSSRKDKFRKDEEGRYPLLLSLINLSPSLSSLYLITTINLISQNLLNTQGSNVKLRNVHLCDTLNNLKKDCNVVYGVSHVEGIDNELNRRGWRRKVDDNIMVLELKGNKIDRQLGKVDEVPPRTEVIKLIGPIPIIATLAYLVIGGFDYLNVTDYFKSADFLSALGYGVRHYLMYYGLGKILDY